MILQRSDIAGGVQPPAADERETRANECANMHVRHMFILYVIQYDKDMCASGLPVMIYSLTLHVPTPYSTGCVRAMPYLPGGGGWSLSKPTLLPHCRVSARLSASDLKRTHGRSGAGRIGGRCANGGDHPPGPPKAGARWPPQKAARAVVS